MLNKFLEIFKNNKKVVLVISGLVSLLLFGVFRACDKKKDIINSDTSLRPGEDEAVIVDPIHRSIIIVKSGKTKKLNLPDRPTRIALMTNDGIKISSPQYGTELRPFIIAAYDLNGGKLGIGADLFYYKRFDVGVGLVVNPVRVQDTVGFIGVSYFVYSNTSIQLGITNQIRPTIGVKVRL